MVVKISKVSVILFFFFFLFYSHRTTTNLLHLIFLAASLPPSSHLPRARSTPMARPQQKRCSHPNGNSYGGGHHTRAEHHAKKQSCSQRVTDIAGRLLAACELNHGTCKTESARAHTRLSILNVRHLRNLQGNV